jgi:hypothetical protein
MLDVAVHLWLFQEQAKPDGLACIRAVGSQEKDRH